MEYSNMKNICTSTSVIYCLKTTPDQPFALRLYRVVLVIMPSKVVLIETAIAIEREIGDISGGEDGITHSLLISSPSPSHNSTLMLIREQAKQK
ncbi:hypothetical protein VNO78_23599 [Psophocarpus tetragonolobus]|uniref:Uncharacterized protein n=1 Tax=Psophocarpus tetragonolobus TaxID=3891 RepID=A0AAN9S3Y3_PSOTE